MNGSRRYRPSVAGHDFDGADDLRFREESSHLEKFYEEDADESETYVREITDAPSEWFLVFFMLMSCGYMLPWTSLGSLITYYKEAYSADFYVKLYCAYYLPGLPVALIQFRYDVYLDLKYGSQNTYLTRGLISFAVMMLILISLLWLKSQAALISLFVLLGICVSLCHGTASMLASMYPPSAIAYLQTGFRCPEIYTLIAVSTLHLGKNAQISSLNTFYILTSGIVLIGASSWTYVVMDEKSKIFFDIKDNRYHQFDSKERIPLLGNKKEIRTDNDSALKKKIKRMEMYTNDIVRIVVDDDLDDYANDPIVLDIDAIYKNKNTVSVCNINENNNDNNNNNNNNNNDNINVSNSSNDSNEEIDATNVSSSSNVSAMKHVDARKEILGVENENENRDKITSKDEKIHVNKNRDESHSGNENDNDNDYDFIYNKPIVKNNALSKFSSYAKRLAHTRNLLERVEKAAMILQSNQNDEYTMNEEIFQKVFPLCLALFIVMWCSIFQASFFAYVSSSKGREIEQILYFVRLFSDLIGRPLTRLPRPCFLKVRFN